MNAFSLPPLEQPSGSDTPLLSRRDFMKAGTIAAATVCGLLPPAVLGQENDFWSRPRSLWLQRASTGEMVREVYWHDGKLYEPGYRAICTLLRDVQAGQVVAMDLRLLDVLRGVQGWLEAYDKSRPMITTSGYRTLKTNARTEGASQNSKHPRGQAWDGHIEGVSTINLAKFGEYLSGGGVGFYQGRGFVHLDSGNLRTWRG